MKINELDNMENSIKETQGFMEELKKAVSSSFNLDNDRVVEALSRRYLKEIVVNKIDGTNRYSIEVYLYGQDIPYSGIEKRVGKDVIISSPLQCAGRNVLPH